MSQSLILDPSLWNSDQVTQSGISTEDADKTYRLYFNGFGDYLYVPEQYGTCAKCPLSMKVNIFMVNGMKNVIDTYLNFNSDGAKVTDSITSAEYIIKALEGEEMLSAIAAKGTDATGLDKSLLVESENLIDVGPNGSAANYIGAMHRQIS